MTILVAVVGGGIYGQTIAWRLALRGSDVVVIEPNAPGNASSGSGDRSRIVRALYDEPCFAASGHASLRLWSEWSKELGQRFIENAGVLYFDRKDTSSASKAWSNWIDRGLANLERLGVAAEELTAKETSRRYEAIDARDLARAVFEPGAGFGRPALATRTIARAGAATGRVRHITGRVLAIEEKNGRAASVRLAPDAEDSMRVHVDRVVVAAGFAGAELVRDFVRLPLQRLPHWTSYWDVPFPEGIDLQMDKLPAWADLGAALYGIPDDGESGFKVAWHAPRTAAANDVDDVRETPTAGQLELLRETAARRFPALRHATPRGIYACAYDATPDEMFFIGAVPSIEGLYFAGGFSGHGFKHAPALSEAIADELTGKEPAIDLARYRLPKPT